MAIYIRKYVILGQFQFIFNQSQRYDLSVHIAHIPISTPPGEWTGVLVSDYPPVQVTPGGNLKLVSSYPL